MHRRSIKLLAQPGLAARLRLALWSTADSRIRILMPKSDEKRGLTLIELLISLSIVTIIMSLLASSLILITRVSADQSQRRRNFDVIQVTQSIANDIQRAVPLANTDGHVFSINVSEDIDGGDHFEIRLATSRPRIFAGEYFCYDIEIRRYYVERSAGGRIDLMLEKRPFLGPGSEEDGEITLLAENIRKFVFTVFSGDEEMGHWSGSDELPLPRSVGISVALAGEESSEYVHVYVPAGNSILMQRETATTN